MERLSGFTDIKKAMGLVFGDIGTSPIYTLTVVFTLIPPVRENILGVLSLILWTLIILVTVEYWWLAMSLSIKGEGGIIVLKETLVNLLDKGRGARFATLLGFIGVSLLMGDGVITPAISILSAVEGIPLIPGVPHVGPQAIIIITIAITVVLFAFQSKGTDKVTSLFGPIMVVWFIVLFVSGVLSIANAPFVLQAVNPYYAVNFMITHGLTGFFVLSEVILCATGGEALYADMGHLGAKPIKSAWIFVFIALFFTYLGQGAFVLGNPKSTLILFEMVKSQSPLLYAPFIALAIAATIIASQAMISAVFSLVYQGITTRVFPLMKIKYTSSHLKSQIYIGAVNWGLMAAVIFMIVLFGSSSALAAAYGLAVTLTMTISSVFMIFIFRKTKLRTKFYVCLLVLAVDALFLFSLLSKLPHGGYWSIIIALFPFLTTLLWINGQKRVYSAFRALPLDVYLFSYEQIYGMNKRIAGTALFFTRSLEEIPSYMAHTTLNSHILYDSNVLVSVERTDMPYGVSSRRVPEMAPGLSGLIITAGYQEILDIQALLKQNDINEKVIFYGVEDVITDSPAMKLYAMMKRLSPNFVQFYKLPYNKIHGIVTRIEL